MISIMTMLAIVAALTHTCTGDCIRYNCGDYTAQSVLALRDARIDAYPVCGYFNHRRHAWVGVTLEFSKTLYIEPQTHEVIMMGDSYTRPMRCIVRGIV